MLTVDFKKFHKAPESSTIFQKATNSSERSQKNSRTPTSQYSYPRLCKMDWFNSSVVSTASLPFVLFTSICSMSIELFRTCWIISEWMAADVMPSASTGSLFSGPFFAALPPALLRLAWYSSAKSMAVSITSFTATLSSELTWMNFLALISFLSFKQFLEW